MKRMIDMETYPRRSHFDYFRAMAYPYVGLTAEVEVGRLVAFGKARGGSPFLACLWAAAQAANAVPQLRQRIAGEGIVEYDHCDTSHTVAMDDGTFRICRTDCRRSLEAFLDYAQMQQQRAKESDGFVEEGEDEENLIFLSCLPWVRFTQLIQPTPIPADSNPRIAFGKFAPHPAGISMPLHIQCNHALVDGRHLGEFYQAFADFANV